MSAALEELVGQKLMIGISGTEATPDVLNLFRQTHAGGLILFRRNFKSPEDLKLLITTLEEKLQRKLLIGVDHEGGRVIHLADGVTAFPDNLALGQTENVEFARKQGEIEAVELRRLGIDINFAPTLDVLTKTFSPNIGIRSYGRDAGLVTRLGIARIQGMQAFGLSACAKHFPGQGPSSMDAHLVAPVLHTSKEEMENIHMIPFQSAIDAGVDAIMSSHPAYPRLDSMPIQPATFSKRIIHDYLRAQMGFEGVIVSDDLEMGAIIDSGGVAEGAVKATQAGHDLLLICSNPQFILEAYHALVAAYDEKQLYRMHLEKSVDRIQCLKNKRKERFGAGEAKPEEHGAVLASEIVKDAFKDSGKEVAERISEWTKDNPEISVIFPRISEMKNKILIEEAMLDEEKLIKDLFAENQVEDCKTQIVSLQPNIEELNKTEAFIEEANVLVFFCYDAHLNEKNLELLQLIESKVEKRIVVFLRDPYDVCFLSPETAFIQAFGFRFVQIQEVVSTLCSVRKEQIPS